MCLLGYSSVVRVLKRWNLVFSSALNVCGGTVKGVLCEGLGGGASELGDVISMNESHVHRVNGGNRSLFVLSGKAGPRS